MRSKLWEKGFLYARFMILATCVLFLSTGTIASAAVFQQVKSNGEYANFGYYGNCEPCGGLVYIYLSVARIGSPSNPETFLSYFIMPFSEGSSGGGSGKIPNEDFTGNMNRLTLKTDLSHVTEGEVYGDFVTGTLHVEWSKEPYLQSGKVVGVQEDEYYGVITRMSGTSTYSSAKAFGSIFSIPIDATGRVGTNSNTVLYFERKVATP